MKKHGPLQIDVFIEAMFQENAFLLWPADSADCWIVDPGFSPQPDDIAAAVAKHNLAPKAVLLTHCHVDHLAGVTPVMDKLPDAALWAPRDEEHMLGDAGNNLSASLGTPVTTPPADRLLTPGEQLTLDSLVWQVLDVGGHSPGGAGHHDHRTGGGGLAHRRGRDHTRS